MKYVRTTEVALSDIEIPRRLRPVDPEEVGSLKESLQELGQITPIQVVEQLRGKRKYRLVAGAHRRAAAEGLEWETIRAEIFKPDSKSALELELREIDENLSRHELNPADRARFVGRRLEILKKQHPEAFGRGGDRRSAVADQTAKLAVGFSEEVQALLKCSQRTVERAMFVYAKLGPELLERLQHTHLAKRGGDLYELGRHSPAHQKVIVDWCLERVAAGDEPGKATVALGKRQVEQNAPPQKSDQEIQVERLEQAFRRASPQAKRTFLTWLVELEFVPSYNEGQL